jgi:hypothetical protein
MSNEQENDASGEPLPRREQPHAHSGTNLETILADMRGEMRERFGRLEVGQDAQIALAEERARVAQKQADHRHAQTQQVLTSLTEKVLGTVPRDEVDRRFREVREDHRADVSEIWTGITRDREIHTASIAAVQKEVGKLRDLRKLLAKVVALAVSAGAIAGGAIEFSAKYVYQHGWPLK